MKIKEFRDSIKDVDRKQLEKAFAECYKCFTKAQKEEVDVVLKAVLSGDNVKAKEKVVDFNELKTEIRIFLENAYAGNYYIPNRIIPKSQRPKWRFLVKDYIKQLLTRLPKDENFEEATVLLEELYKMLCYGCTCYIFSSEDPFRSVGWQQDALFYEIIIRKFVKGYNVENITRMLKLVIEEGISREALHFEQELIFVRQLKNDEARNLALQEVDNLVKVIKQRSANKKLSWNVQYMLNEEISYLIDIYLMIMASLDELKKGLDYYFKNSTRTNKEIDLYCILRIFEDLDENEMWLKTYKYGLTKKIKPRDGIVELYNEKTKSCC